MSSTTTRRKMMKARWPLKVKTWATIRHLATSNTLSTTRGRNWKSLNKKTTCFVASQTKREFKISTKLYTREEEVLQAKKRVERA